MAGGSVLPNLSSRQRPLAGCIATAFALTAPTSLLAQVSNCFDDGSPGSLRSVITAAAEGATITFPGLDCTAQASKITLSGTPLFISKNNLTLDASGAAKPFAVDASSLPHGYVDSRVITHTGSGTLTVKNLTLKGGYIFHYSLPSTGGCISSSGNVTLQNSTVTQCSNTNIGFIYSTIGGAIAASGDVTLTNSVVSQGYAAGAKGAFGGGIFANNVKMSSISAVTNNQANSGGNNARGGGVYTGNLNMYTYSIVSHNSVTAGGDASGGGAFVVGNLNSGSGGASLGYSAFFYDNSATSTGTGALATARGGGVFASTAFNAGNQTQVKYNTVTSNAKDASGGGVYAAGTFYSFGANIYGNTVTSTSGTVRGGGFRAVGTSVVKYSSIHDNHANTVKGFAGGMFLQSSATFRHSTISGNTAGHNVGGISAATGSPSQTLVIESSTISDNTAVNLIGGIYNNFATANFYNNTIAFNTAGSSTFSPGVSLQGTSSVLLQNTLISNNSVGTADNDLDAGGSVTFSASSSTNLIRATFANLPPGSATFLQCPLLGPLRNNGGLTNTRALLSRSPAIDQGGPTDFTANYDQRGGAAVNGTVNYPRKVGPISGTPVEDIGAYEVQQNEIIFNNTFEGCNALF